MPPPQNKDNREGLNAWAGALACPACQQPLHLETDQVKTGQVVTDQIVCTACSRAYPILEGIPVLIAERAEIPLASPSSQEAERS